MLSAAACLRVGILAAWAVVFGAHAANLLRPAGGRLEPERESRVDQRLTYALRLDARGTRAVGSCTVMVERAPHGFSTRTHALVTDASFLPGFAQARQLLEQPGNVSTRQNQTVQLDLEEDLDRALGLTRAAASVTAFGVTARAEAAFADSGVSGTWAVEDRSGPLTWTRPRSGDISAALLVASLPPGLRAHERFSIDLLGADLVARAPSVRRAQFAVASEEEVPTLSGALVLLRVDALADGGAIAEPTLWCDSTGLVYRQRFDSIGLTVELLAVSTSRPTASASSTRSAAPSPAVRAP